MLYWLCHHATLNLTLPNTPMRQSYLAGVIFDRTRVPAWYSWPPLRPESIHRCMATAYSGVLCDCTETRCIPCRRSQNRQFDRRLETRSSAPAANPRSTECHRRPCIASMSLRFRALCSKNKVRLDNNVRCIRVWYYQPTVYWLCLLKYILSGINAIMFYKTNDLLTFLCCTSITMKSYRSFASTAVILCSKTYCEITKLNWLV